jgi:hypothetical protein
MDLCAPGWEAANRPAEPLPAPRPFSRMDTPGTDAFGATWSTFSGAVADLDNTPYSAVALPTQKNLEGGFSCQLPPTANK